MLVNIFVLSTVTIFYNYNTFSGLSWFPTPAEAAEWGYGEGKNGEFSKCYELLFLNDDLLTSVSGY